MKNERIRGLLRRMAVCLTRKESFRIYKGLWMNRFYADVYEIVARIPAGKVATYGQIASMLGNPLAARQVGYAMSAAPEDSEIPCHRVVNRKGEMLSGIAFGGAAAQRKRLEAEGVCFRPDGCVDFARSLWRPEFMIL